MGHKKDRNKIPAHASTNNKISAQIKQSVLQINKGPLPPPAILRQYEEVYPGAAKSIFDAFEKQVNHRIELENKHMEAGIRNSRIGMNLAFIIAMTAIIGGVICILLGKSAEGISAIITALTSLFGTYVFGKHTEKKERDQKLKEVMK